jgi:N,N'-diacetyllegionaminate synthase
MHLIAETAMHHDGDFYFFKDLIENISQKTDAEYIKIHVTLDVDEYMHTDHPAYQWLKDRLFDEQQWAEVLNLVLKSGKKLMLLFNDKKAIDFGMGFNPDIVEIHSVCLNDFNLLSHLKSKILEQTKVVLGVGGSTVYEIENAISILNHKNIVLMHGFQNYPTKYEDINFGKIRRMMQLFPEYEHGYADHTAWNNEHNILITLFGATLGMEYVEKHVTTAWGKERCDWSAAISIEMFNELSEKLNLLSATNGTGFLKLNSGELSYSTFGANKKAAILSKKVSHGDILTPDCYSFKRTSQASDLSQLDIISGTGKVFKETLPEGHCIVKSNLE